MPGVFDPEVYGEPVFSDLLSDTEVYGEVPLDDGAGGANVLMSGASAGTSTATAALVVDVALSGSSAGVASTIGLLTVFGTVELSGSSAGTSATAGALSIDVALSGSSAGTSTATGSIAFIIEMSGSSAGTSTASGVLSADIGLSGSSAGTSTASGVLSKVVNLSGSSAGTSTGTGVLSSVGYVLLSGSSSGISTTSGKLTGGSTNAGIIVIAPQVTEPATSDSPAGSTTIEVADGATFTEGQTIVIEGVAYIIEDITGDVLTLSSPLLSNVITGDYIYGIVTTAVNTGGYAVAHESLIQLESMHPRTAIMVEMQDRHPVYVRSQPVERTFEFSIHLLANTVTQRRADYEEFINSLDSLSGLVTLTWTDEEGTQKALEVSPLSASPDAWYNRAAVVFIASTLESKVAA